MKDTLCTWHKNISNLAILLCDIISDDYKKIEIICEVVYPILSVEIKWEIVSGGGGQVRAIPKDADTEDDHLRAAITEATKQRAARNNLLRNSNQ